MKFTSIILLLSLHLVITTEIDPKLILDYYIHDLQNPPIYQEVIFNYYMDQATKYWLELEHSLFNNGTESSILSNGYDFEKGRSTIDDIYINHIGRYITRYNHVREVYPKCYYLFWNHFNKIIENFKKSRKISIDDLNNLFYFIGSMRCAMIDSIYSIRNLPISQSNKYIFLLVDGKGIFEIDTYLHALFNNVTLVGLPSGFSIFDDFMGCPIEFYTHDLAHSMNVYNNLFQPHKKQILEQVQGIYYRIINDCELDPDDRNCLLFVLYYIVHESRQFNDKLFTTDSQLSDFLNSELNKINEFNKKMSNTKHKKLEVGKFYDAPQKFREFEACFNLFYEYVSH